MCNANSWHFNSHFGRYFFSLRSVFIRHTTPCFTQLPFFLNSLNFYFFPFLILFLSSHSTELHQKKNYFFLFFFHSLKVSSFWLFKLFMGRLCENILGRVEDFLLFSSSPEVLLHDTVNGPKRFLLYSWRLCGNREKRKIHLAQFFD